MLDSLLQAQDLTTADLDDNRAGKVSQRQVDQINAHRSRLNGIFFSITGIPLVVSIGVALWHYNKFHDAAIWAAPGTAAVVGIIVGFIFFTMLRLPSIAGKKATLVEGPVAGILHIASKGGYVVSINGVRYKGVSTKVASLDLKGKNVKAYVVAEDKIVVAIEPA